MTLTKAHNRMIEGAKINVLDFIPQSEHAAIRAGTSTYDCTSAFNDALQFNVPFANVKQRTVYVPEGNYVISSTLYLRAGCALEGAGSTSSILDGNSATFTQFVKMGVGLISGSEVSDSSGLSPRVENIFFRSATAAGIECAGQAGWRIKSCWFSLAGTAILAGGADGIIHDCIIDAGNFTGIVVTGSRILISDSLFVNPNYGIVFSTPEFAKVSEIQVDNCQFFASAFAASYAFSTAIIKDVMFNDCLFTTSTGSGVRQSDQKHFWTQAGSQFDHISFNGCRFENSKFRDIFIQSGTGFIQLSGCSFFNTGIDDGGATRSLQHSIVLTSNATLHADGCFFNLVGGQSIRLESNGATAKIVGCHNYNCGQGGSGLASEAITGDRAHFHFRNGCTEIFVGNCTTDISTLFVAGSHNFSHYTAANCKSNFTHDTYSSTTGGVYEGVRHFQDGTLDVINIVGTSKHYFLSAEPASGTYAVGDIVWNNTPAAGGTIGWVCTSAGTPGTWKTFGTIAV
jgi:hypothetical protein